MTTITFLCLSSTTTFHSVLITDCCSEAPCSTGWFLEVWPPLSITIRHVAGLDGRMVTVFGRAPDVASSRHGWRCRSKSRAANPEHLTCQDSRHLASVLDRSPSPTLWRHRDIGAISTRSPLPPSIESRTAVDVEARWTKHRNIRDRRRRHPDDISTLIRELAFC